MSSISRLPPVKAVARILLILLVCSWFFIHSIPRNRIDVNYRGSICFSIFITDLTRKNQGLRKVFGKSQLMSVFLDRCTVHIYNLKIQQHEKTDLTLVRQLLCKISSFLFFWKKGKTRYTEILASHGGFFKKKPKKKTNVSG